MTEQEWREEFGRRITKLKYRAGEMNQKELAKASGISKDAISRYINGTRTPSAYNLVRLANALHCSIDDLLPTVNK